MSMYSAIDFMVGVPISGYVLPDFAFAQMLHFHDLIEEGRIFDGNGRVADPQCLNYLRYVLSYGERLQLCELTDLLYRST